MYSINHIHLRAPDPRTTARWYVDMFGATIAGEGEGLGGSIAIRLDIGGTRVNVSSAQIGESLPEGTSDSHYGLEHFGLETDDIEAAMAELESHGTEVLLPVTVMGSGAKISYVKGPDNVRIELVQSA